MKSPTLIGIAVLLLIGGVPAAQGQSDTDSWEFMIAPYFWAANIDDDIEIGRLEAQASLDTGDIIDTLEIGGMVKIEARKGPWGVLVDSLYMKLSDETGRGPVKLDGEVTQFMLEVAGAYQFGEPGRSFDLIAGARYMSLDAEIDIDPGPDGSRDKDWVDPLVGGRFQADLSDAWFLSLRGDVGGFGAGSDLTWQALGVLGYRFNDTVSVGVGYRYMDVDYDKGSFKYDSQTYGPIAGISFRF